MRSRVFYTLYQWQRHRVLGWTLTRWLFLLLLLLGALTALHILPGGQLLAFLWVFMAIGGWVLLYWATREWFVTFSGEDTSLPAEPRQDAPRPGERSPVRVTGRVEVGERTQVVVDVIGYVERFANGEWAIAAMVPPSRYAVIGTLPWQFEGMWYQFIAPERVVGGRMGRLKVNGHQEQALEIRYATATGHVHTLYLAAAPSFLAVMWHTLHPSPVI